MCPPAVRVSHSARDCSRLKSLPWDRTLASKACILYYYPLCASLGLQCSVPQSQILACLPSILVKPYRSSVSCKTCGSRVQPTMSAMLSAGSQVSCWGANPVHRTLNLLRPLIIFWPTMRSTSNTFSAIAGDDNTLLVPPGEQSACKQNHENKNKLKN